MTGFESSLGHASMDFSSTAFAAQSFDNRSEDGLSQTLSSCIGQSRLPCTRQNYAAVSGFMERHKSKWVMFTHDPEDKGSLRYLLSNSPLGAAFSKEFETVRTDDSKSQKFQKVTNTKKAVRPSTSSDSSTETSEFSTTASPLATHIVVPVDEPIESIEESPEEQTRAIRITLGDIKKTWVDGTVKSMGRAVQLEPLKELLKILLPKSRNFPYARPGESVATLAPAFWPQQTGEDGVRWINANRLTKIELNRLYKHFILVLPGDRGFREEIKKLSYKNFRQVWELAIEDCSFDTGHNRGIRSAHSSNTPHFQDENLTTMHSKEAATKTLQGESLRPDKKKRDRKRRDQCQIEQKSREERKACMRSLGNIIEAIENSCSSCLGDEACISVYKWTPHDRKWPKKTPDYPSVRCQTLDMSQTSRKRPATTHLSNSMGRSLTSQSSPSLVSVETLPPSNANPQKLHRYTAMNAPDSRTQASPNSKHNTPDTNNDRMTTYHIGDQENGMAATTDILHYMNLHGVQGVSTVVEPASKWRGDLYDNRMFVLERPNSTLGFSTLVPNSLTPSTRDGENAYVSRGFRKTTNKPCTNSDYTNPRVIPSWPMDASMNQ